MATYKLKTKNDIKFICILDREVIYIFINISFSYLEYSNNVFQF